MLNTHAFATLVLNESQSDFFLTPVILASKSLSILWKFKQIEGFLLYHSLEEKLNICYSQILMPARGDSRVAL